MFFNTLLIVFYTEHMTPEDINYKSLRKIQQLEKNSPALTKIDPDFYPHLAAYCTRLEDLAQKQTDTAKAKLLADETQNIKKIAMHIYELREKKIVQAALSTTRGGKPELKNLVDSEQVLYDGLVTVIRDTRKNMMTPDAPAKPAENPATAPATSAEHPPGNTNPLVRMTETVPAFVGTDMKTYHLRKDDILSISEEMKTPLVRRGVAKEINTEG